MSVLIGVRILHRYGSLRVGIRHYEKKVKILAQVKEETVSYTCVYLI